MFLNCLLVYLLIVVCLLVFLYRIGVKFVDNCVRFLVLDGCIFWLLLVGWNFYEMFLMVLVRYWEFVVVW